MSRSSSISAESDHSLRSYVPLSVRKFGHRLNMGECCHHDSYFNNMPLKELRKAY